MLYISIIIRKKVIKMQYSKLSFGGGSCLFSATCWGWVTNILCYYEGVGHVFFKELGFHFLRPNPPPLLYFLTSPYVLQWIMESVTRHFRKRGLNRKASRPEIDHNALRLNEMRSFKPFIHCETLRNAD